MTLIWCGRFTLILLFEFVQWKPRERPQTVMSFHFFFFFISIFRLHIVALARDQRHQLCSDLALSRVSVSCTVMSATLQTLLHVVNTATIEILGFFNSDFHTLESVGGERERRAKRSVVEKNVRRNFHVQSTFVWLRFVKSVEIVIEMAESNPHFTRHIIASCRSIHSNLDYRSSLCALHTKHSQNWKFNSSLIPWGFDMQNSLCATEVPAANQQQG